MKDLKKESQNKVIKLNTGLAPAEQLTPKEISRIHDTKQRTTSAGNVITRITYCFDDKGDLLYQFIQTFIVKDASIVAPITTLPLTVIRFLPKAA